MSRTLGAIAGVTTALGAIYIVDEQFKANTRAITGQLKLADDMVRNKPHLVRPYTEPINLTTQTIGDAAVDIWNAQIVRAVDWVYALQAK